MEIIKALLVIGNLMCVIANFYCFKICKGFSSFLNLVAALICIANAIWILTW